MGLAKPLLLTALVLLSSFSPAQCVSAGGGGAEGSGQRRSEQPRWEILTKRNFSSQIRLNPHILLMVTVPWSGESQSLMKEVANLVAGKEEEFRYLKLMVVFRNSEKMLADALGAPDGITLFYYHHSISYKYQGRLRAQNIMSSVYHFMLHQIEEVPLKPLHTQRELDSFFQSTDKAILLVELCGWSTDLLRRANHENNKTTESIWTNKETAGLVDENLSREADGKVLFEKTRNQKIQVLNSEEQTCRFESGLADTSLQGGSIWSNQTSSHGPNCGSDDQDISCTVENFHKFKSFFLEFMKIAREYFLPPERHRFGLISERSLLPYLGVGNLETWLVVLRFAGCSNCSIIAHEGDELRTILQTHHAIVEEVDAEGSPEAEFPANRPSVILFIDRSSDSSKLRGESKSALQVLRKFVEDNQLSNQNFQVQDGSHHRLSSRETLPKIRSPLISDHSSQKSVNPKLVKFHDNMAFMITNKGKSISLDAGAQGNSLYNILSNLLNQKKPTMETTETKISLLAKEVGFQLLSDDFEVRIADSPSSHNDDSDLKYIHDSAIPSMEDQTSKLLLESKEDYIVSNKILLDSADIAPVNEEKQPGQTNTNNYLQQNQEMIPYSESRINKLFTTLPKELEDDISSSRGTQLNKDHKSRENKVSQSFTCPVKDVDNKVSQSFTCPVKDVEQEWPMMEKAVSDPIDCRLRKAYSGLGKQNVAGVTLGKDLVGNDADGFITSKSASTSDERHYQQLPFKGSFFFSDGGYQLLRSLTGGTKVPSLVILDPILQHHYVYPEDTNINYSSLGIFMNDFLNGILTPYQRSASTVTSSRESSRPPFVNMDFHETDSIPQVTANTFCELIVGYKPCHMRNELPLSQIQNFRSVWKMDVLVLFSTSWCGFCQRMELVVREVYRAFKTFAAMLQSESQNRDPMHIQDNADDTLPNGLPSIFLMDCTMNDCGAYLKPINKEEHYPALLLFPAENKTAMTYEGDISVASIIEFLISHGRSSHFLTRHKGFLWTPSLRGGRKSSTDDDSSPAYESFVVNKNNEILLDNAVRGDDDLLVGSYKPNNMHHGGHHVSVGSVLVATDELLHVAPFDNSTILMVMADKIQGFQGMIINKRISWDIFKQLDEQLEPLKQAPLFYGGPVRAHGLPLVSLARKVIEGYMKVISGIYYGDPLATRSAIEEIKSGDQSAYDFWFFLGYSSWAWNQLFDELAAGAWHLSESTIGNLEWPDA